MNYDLFLLQLHPQAPNLCSFYGNNDPWPLLDTYICYQLNELLCFFLTAYKRKKKVLFLQISSVCLETKTSQMEQEKQIKQQQLTFVLYARCAQIPMDKNLFHPSLCSFYLATCPWMKHVDNAALTNLLKCTMCHWQGGIITLDSCGTS